MDFSTDSSTEKGWDCFPDEFVRGLRETLGAEKFESLTVLAEKYRLFDQDLFIHPESFTDIHNEITKLDIAALLTNMGNELVRRHIIEDAEKTFQIVLSLRPEHFAARAMLAVICYDSGRLSEARKYARRTIADMDNHVEQYKDVDIPKHIFDAEYFSATIAPFRLLLQSIAKGKVSD